MTLSRFIRERAEQILDDWIAFARSIPSASLFDDATLRDHAAGILEAVAVDLEQPQDPQCQEAKSKGETSHTTEISQARQHGAARLFDGFTVSDAVAEFRALRASVLRHWDRTHEDSEVYDILELTRFNEAIDQAITESLVGFSADKERSESLVNALLRASRDLAFVVDLDGNLLYGNAALASEFGRPLSAQQGCPFGQLELQAANNFRNRIRQAVDTALPVRDELERRRGDRLVVYEYILVAVPDQCGKSFAVAGNARDITKRKSTEDRLRRGAHYDHLTGLPNRYLFLDRLEQEIKRAGRIHLPLALLYIDLDGFKLINDQFGHESGDELLRECAQRIGACVRETDTVARLGGDEFTSIITELADLPHVDLIAQHILDELSRPFLVKGRELAVSGSIGIALYPRDARSPEELVRNADNALYTAKEAGRNIVRFFTEEMRKTASVRLQTITELRQALAGRQFAVFYQPIVDLQAEIIVGAEAQLRWQHPVRGLLPALEFFPLAAEAGLADPIDEWVIADALAHADTWNKQRDVPLYVSINQSTLAVTGKKASAHRRAIFDRINQAASPFALEITEITMSGQTAAAATFKQVADAGGQIYLDGFGTALSSITTLTTDGLTGIKIDSAIVQSLGQASTRAIVKGIINIAHGLGLKVVAKGVETEEQRDVLRLMECDYAQGFLFFRAMPAHRFAEIIRRERGPFGGCNT